MNESDNYQLVPLKDVILPGGEFNVRTTEDLNPDFVESIRTNGLINPLVVERVVDVGLVLRAGFRRYAALTKIGAKVAPVQVREFAGGVTEATVVNLAENTARKDVHPSDVAKRLFELSTGTFPGSPGVEAALDPKDIAASMGLSISHVNNLIRAWKKLCDDVKSEWQNYDVPAAQAFAWAKLKSPEEQVQAFTDWKETAQTPRPRKASVKDKEETENDGPAERTSPTKKQITEKLDSFRERLANDPPRGRDRADADAKIETLRWVLGEIKRLALS